VDSLVHQLEKFRQLMHTKLKLHRHQRATVLMDKTTALGRLKDKAKDVVKLNSAMDEYTNLISALSLDMQEAMASAAASLQGGSLYVSQLDSFNVAVKKVEDEWQSLQLHCRAAVCMCVNSSALTLL
jgi:hypothetical protein